jgi:LuxR family maltose regulon positive regulatory protein
MAEASPASPGGLLPAGSLLATKLFVPPPGPCLVERPRLLEKLNQALRPGCRLTLVSAPPGFGKTTLVSTWALSARAARTGGAPVPPARSGPGRAAAQVQAGTLARGAKPGRAGAEPGLSVAWLSLDERDNDPVLFWSYVCASLHGQASSLGQGAQALLRSVQGANFEAVLAALINDLARLPAPVLLVLDDFHLIRSPAIINSLGFLLDRMPPQFHLLILTRSDPHLPLALLRSRGQLLDIRQDDLRFSAHEAGSFLNAGMGLDLAPQAVEALHARTEGWAAGLQLAAVSLRGREKADEFIASFSGSNRYILDYLFEEVLKRQPSESQTFLLKTSILDSFCGPLCAALLAGTALGPFPDAQAVLGYLESNNLFVVPLDEERRWYRYHQLFADLLRKRLRQTDPASEAELHARASRWYEQADLPYPAVDHALRVPDYARAGRLLADSAEAILNRGEYSWLLQSIRKLPAAQAQAHPELYIVEATILASTGYLNEAEECLRSFEEHAPAAALDAPLSDWLAGRTATVRALIAILQGDAAGSRRYAGLALEKLPRGSESPWRAHLLVALSHLNVASGDLEAARQDLVEAVEAGKLARHAYMTLDAATHLSLTLWMQGRLNEACQVNQQALQFVEQLGGLDGTLEAGMLFLGWGFILCERHELDEAGEYIRHGLEASRSAGNPGTLAWAYQVFIRFLIAQGDLPAAEAAAREADRLVQGSDIPAWIECGAAALIAQVWVRLGKIAAAEQYLARRGILLGGEIQYPHQAEYHALACLFLAKGELDAAEQLFERLREWAEIAGQRSWVIAAQVQLALVYRARGQRQPALQALTRAMELAEPEGYVQLFVDEGEALAGLIRDVPLDYARRLLAAFPGAKAGPVGVTGVRQRAPALFDDLSPREVEVLRLVAEGLSNKEIALQLCISLRTVKYHTNSIYTKLNVSSRTQAVGQARALGIL